LIAQELEHVQFKSNNTGVIEDRINQILDANNGGLVYIKGRTMSIV